MLFKCILSAALFIFTLVPALSLEAKAKQSPHIHKYATAVEDFLTPISSIEPRSGLDGVDAIYVINLIYRREKWQRTQKLFQEYGLCPTLVNAVDGTKLLKKDLKKLFGHYSSDLRRGQVGCLLSHVSVYADAYKRNLDCVWVCEDDVDLIESPLQMQALIEQLTAIDPDWDILYTDREQIIPSCYKGQEAGGEMLNLSFNFRPDQTHLPKSHYLERQKINETFTRLGQRYGLYSYLISKRGLEKLVNYFLHVYLWAAVDADIHYVPNIREYTLNKKVASHSIDSGTNDSQNL